MFMERALFAFSVRRRQVRHISTARFSVEQWEQLLESTCLMHEVLREMTNKLQDDGSFLFERAQIAKA